MAEENKGSGKKAQKGHLKGQKTAKLSVRIIMYCSALAAALCVILGGLGYYIYYKEAMSSYEMYINSILNVVDSTVDADDMAECIKKCETSPSYEQTQRLINNIKINTEVEFIYMIAPQNPKDIYDVVYVCNAFTEEERFETPEDLVDICTPIQEDAFTEDMLVVFNEAMYGDGEVSFIPNNAGFGNMLTGTKPLVGADGKTVCLICVDFSMQEIYNTLYEYIFSVVIGTVITAAVALLLIIGSIQKTVVVPIQAMAAAAGNFVKLSHSTQDVSALTYEKPEIKRTDEIRLLSDSIADMTQDMVDYMKNLTQATADKERISAQLDVASQIQNGMIPKTYPAFPERTEFDIFGDIHFSRQMGGAFYDYFFSDKNHICFFIGDIDHAGVPAALMMVIARTMIKNYARIGYDVDKIFQETNNQLSGSNESAGMKITAFMGILDVESGILTYVNADHVQPYLKRAGEKFEPLPAKACFALGSMANVPYWKQSVQLNQGDLLFMHTSGIITACDHKGEEFSSQRLFNTLNIIIDEEYRMEAIAGRVEEAVIKFTDGVKQDKDRALLLLRYFG